LYRRKIPAQQIVTHELAQTLCQLSRSIGRQVGIFVTRRGQVDNVFVGDAVRLELPDFGRLRAGRGRFRGVRLIHSHLDDVALTSDDLTDLALLRLDLVVALHQPTEDQPVVVQYAHLQPPNAGPEPHRVEPPLPLHRLDVDFIELITLLESEFGAATQTITIGRNELPAILVCVTPGSHDTALERIAEMRELARTAGIAILEVVHQRRAKPDPRFAVGRGKLEGILVRAMQIGAEFLLFDPDLTPTQARAVSNHTDYKVLDRTMLILDIFAQRATSREGKLQVELAQLRYSLPRLVAKNTMMSRLMGGIGGRGPGETKLEINRRRARDRLNRLEREIDKISQRRNLTRQRRQRRKIPVVAIVGYTNAGKSTLLNTLTSSKVFTEDKLFATLDPTTRRLRFPRERELVLTDTVGFIRELPEELARAFRATLEELEDANLLLHLVDAAAPGSTERFDAVERILGDMGLGNIERLVVYNKIDRIQGKPTPLPGPRQETFHISALQAETCRPLLNAIEQRLWTRSKTTRSDTTPAT
jgi:GTPase